MKRKIILLLLFFLQMIFANSNPKIGVILEEINPYPLNTSCVFNLKIKIKNTGDVPLYNIFVQNIQDPMQQYKNIDISGLTISNLQPGEINEIAFTGSTNATIYDCYGFQKQIEVVASELSGSLVTDLSHYDNYFLDEVTYLTFMSRSLNINKVITYLDLNSNSIVDVGDAVKYNYSFEYYKGNCGDYMLSIYPVESGVNFNNNEIVVYDNSAILNNDLEGIHYLTSQDINLGYLYGTNSNFIYNNGSSYICMINNTYSPMSSVTIPYGYDSVIKLTDLNPNQITGTVTYNSGSNNCANGLTLGSNVKASNGIYTYETYTNSNGEYSIIVPNNGTYNVSIDGLYNNSNFTINPNNYSVSSASQNQEYSGNNFCVSSANNYSNLGISVYPSDGMPSRPGFDSEFVVSVSNIGSTMIDASVDLNFDVNKVSYLSSIPLSSVNGNNVNWTINALAPFQNKTFKVKFNVAQPPIVQSGDVLPFQLNVNANGQNYSTILNQEVVNSYDPNDITVLEGDEINSNDLNKYLHFLVRFQNTGTASASTVVVKQSLDSKLDWNTFEPVASSHESLIQIKNDNEVSYTFSDINLTSNSINEPDSHGWLLYKIKPKSNLVVGNIIQGVANIYFDYNSPITTNTANVEVVDFTLSNENFENNSNIKIYPNPSNDYLNIEIKNNENLSFKLYNQLGQTVRVVKMKDTIVKIDVKDLPKGIYYLKCLDKKGINKKIIVN